MKTYKKPGQKTIYILEKQDILLIILIFLGVDSCTDLAIATKKAKSTISNHVHRLSTAGFILILEQNSKQNFRYEITKKGIKQANLILEQKIII